MSSATETLSKPRERRVMRIVSQEDRSGWLAALPPLAFLLIFFVVPTILLFVTSFFTARSFVIEHVFGDLGLDKLWCEVLVENEAVWKMHEAFGFRREALFRRHAWKSGQPSDVVGLGLLASDWAAVRDESRARLRARGLPV